MNILSAVGSWFNAIWKKFDNWLSEGEDHTSDHDCCDH